MDFNFYEQYQQLKNSALLLIIERQQNYQEAAIAAAKKVLDEREITEDDRRAVQEVLDGEAYAAEQKKQKKQKKEKVVAEVAGYLVPLEHSPKKFDEYKWLNIVLVGMCIYFLMRVYSNVESLRFIYNCESCEVDLLTVLTFMEIIFMPVALYLFWKRRRWGWMLIMGFSIFVLGDRIGQLVSVFIQSTGYWIDSKSLIISIFVRSAFIYALWQKNVVEIFSLSRKDKESTLIVVSVLLFLYLSCMVIWINGISF